MGINLPVVTISTTYIVNARHFGDMAFDGSYSFFTQFSKFLSCNPRSLSYLIFYPSIKSSILSIILSITLSITLVGLIKVTTTKLCGLTMLVT